MNRAEYYKKVTRTVRNGAIELRKMNAEYEKLVEERDSGKYDQRYLIKELLPQMNSLRMKIYDRKVKIEGELEEINEAYGRELYGEDSLKAEELNDDVKLLNSGLKLTERDLCDILDRNEENRTMTQLTLRYAEEHGIDLHRWYVSAEQQKSDLDGVLYTAKIVLKWWEDEHTYEKMYDSLMGEGSSIAEWAGMSEAEQNGYVPVEDEVEDDHDGAVEEVAEGLGGVFLEVSN